MNIRNPKKCGLNFTIMRHWWSCSHPFWKALNTSVICGRWPLIRIIFGYRYISLALDRIRAGYLEHAYISEYFNLSGSDLRIPDFYFQLFKNLVQSQWFQLTCVFISLEVLIGISYVLGFCVRLAGLFGIILSFHIYLFFSAQYGTGQIYMFYLHLLFLLSGAGRCLGFDYYFFKSRRGLFW